MSVGLLSLLAIFIALSVVGAMVRRDGHLHLRAQPRPQRG